MTATIYNFLASGSLTISPAPPPLRSPHVHPPFPEDSAPPAPAAAKWWSAQGREEEREEEIEGDRENVKAQVWHLPI